MFIFTVHFCNPSRIYFKAKCNSNQLSITTNILEDYFIITMSKLMLPTLFLFLAFWLVGGSWYFAKYSNSAIFNNSVISNSTFKIEDENLHFTAKSNYYFKRSSAKLIVPKETLKGLKAIATHLNNQPSIKLDLTGLYSSVEIEGSSSRDLGLARARALRNQFTKLGVLPQSINIQSLMVANINMTNDILSGGVLISILKDKESRLTETDRYVADSGMKILEVRPLNLYYNNQKKGLKLTPELKEYFEDLKFVLTKEPTANIIITGHTDNVGSRKENLKLSKSRANNVRNFMINHGFDKEKLVVRFKGPDDPIASNEIESGRKKKSAGRDQN